VSKIKSPQEKKKLSYARDHYTRGGESARAWRRTKQVKKAHTRRSFRRAANDSVRESDDSDISKKGRAILQKKVHDWGSVRLQDFVKTRKRVKSSKGHAS
jgi:hypothetical protein